VTTVGRTSTGWRKPGGLAALYLAAAYLLAMPFFLIVVKYPSVVDPAEKVALLASHQGSMHIMYLITYVIFGVVLAVLALALHQRLKPAGPVVMQVATAVGLMWAVVLVASGMVFNAGMAAVAAAYPADPGQAVSMWQAIEPIALGLGGSGGEILGGLWVLLVSFAGLRANALPKALARLGVAVGLVGILSLIPPLKDVAVAFGLLQIGWFVWLGIAMLHTTERSERLIALEAQPA
jgi:MFS family permease